MEQQVVEFKFHLAHLPVDLGIERHHLTEGLSTALRKDLTRQLLIQTISGTPT